MKEEENVELRTNMVVGPFLRDMECMECRRVHASATSRLNQPYPRIADSVAYCKERLVVEGKLVMGALWVSNTSSNLILNSAESQCS